MVGSPIRLETPGGKFLNLRVHAIVAPPRGGSPLGTVTISSQAFDSVYPNPQNVFTFVNTPGGVTPANTAKLNAVLDAYPDAKIQTEASSSTTRSRASTSSSSCSTSCSGSRSSSACSGS